MTEPRNVEGGRKDDAGKLRYDLVPPVAERELVRVLTFGASKYGPNQWQKVPEARDRYLAAARRHMAAWQMGERFDPESGIHHLAHATCSLLFILAIEIANGPEK